MYLHPFQNEYVEHDFSSISDCIKQYYPVGSEERLTHEAFASTDGFQELKKLAVANFQSQKTYRQNWGKLTSHLKKLLKKRVDGFPDMSGNGFVGEIIVSEDKQPGFIRHKSLYFFISVIGPFFSIQGVDRSTAILPVDSMRYGMSEGNFTATHAVTVSPAFEYEEIFTMLENELRAYFHGYSFVPYDIGMSTIKNISPVDQVNHTQIMDTVYEALFGRMAVHACLTRGDNRYGYKDWIKPFTEDEKSLMDAISKHVIAGESGLTVHKVWKYIESKPLNTYTVTGNLFFGTDTFDIIDLTDSSTMFVLSERERKTPGSFQYQIVDNTITFTNAISMKIISLTHDSLTLHLIIDFADGDVSAKGAIAEVKYIQMKKID